MHVKSDLSAAHYYFKVPRRVFCIITKSEIFFAFLALFPEFCYFSFKKRIILRNNLTNIGEVLRKRREVLGLLQTQLASISGVSTRTIQLVELGKANPSLETLIKIADPLGLQINLMLKEPGTINQNP